MFQIMAWAISLLSIPGKPIGSQICRLIYDHLKQWGFTKGLTTEGMLISMTEKWTVGAVFIDFQKAFDTVQYTNILKAGRLLACAVTYFDRLCCCCHLQCHRVLPCYILISRKRQQVAMLNAAMECIESLVLARWRHVKRRITRRRRF